MKFDIEEIKDFSILIQDNKNISKLVLSYNKMTDQEIEPIINNIRLNTALEILDLSSNNITAEGMKCVANALKDNKTLITLNLNNNQIFDDGCSSIETILKQNKKLKQLFMANNGILELGVVSISLGLLANNHLNELNLSKNRKGAALSDCFISNKALRILDLSNNILGCDDIMKLYKDLMKNMNIKELNISSNFCEKKWSEITGQFIRANEYITKMIIDDNEFTDEGSVTLGKAIEFNPSLTYLSIGNSNKILNNFL